MDTIEYENCKTNFNHFASNYVNVSGPTRRNSKFELYPFQQRLVDDYEKHDYLILKKYRQGGFTTLSCLYSLWKCMFHCDQSILIATKYDREALHISNVVDNAIKNLPEWLSPDLKKSNNHEKWFAKTNSRLSFHSLHASIGKQITMLVVDEAAFIPDMERHWKSAYPCLAGGSKVIIQSTPNGVGDWFYDTYQQAEAGTNSFHIHETNYLDHPNMTPELVEKLWVNLGELGFFQEVEGRFVIKDYLKDPTIVDQLLDLASSKKLTRNERKLILEAISQLEEAVG